MMNELRRQRLSKRLAITALLAIFIGGCIQPVPQIDMPATTIGDAEVFQLNADTGDVDHVTMAMADAIDSSEKTVVIDFYADWCGPCAMLSPELEQVAKTLDSSVVVLKVDIDDHPEMAQHFQVSSIPDVRFFRNGKVTGGFRGFKTADAIIPMLQD